MTRRISNLSVILSFFATVTAIYLGPVIVEAEESQGDLKSHTAVSHLLDGKKFIGPTGEKGKKVHHEDILKFSGGKFTSPECFQYGFKAVSIQQPSRVMRFISRLIPLKAFARFVGWLHLAKSRDLVLQLEPLNSEQKLDFLLKTAPSKIVSFLLKQRYLMIALVLNLPGNALIGGGGGIGLITGSE